MHIAHNGYSLFQHLKIPFLCGGSSKMIERKDLETRSETGPSEGGIRWSYTELDCQRRDMKLKVSLPVFKGVCGIQETVLLQEVLQRQAVLEEGCLRRPASSTSCRRLALCFLLSPRGHPVFFTMMLFFSHWLVLFLVKRPKGIHLDYKWLLSVPIKSVNLLKYWTEELNLSFKIFYHSDFS